MKTIVIAIISLCVFSTLTHAAAWMAEDGDLFMTTYMVDYRSQGLWAGDLKYNFSNYEIKKTLSIVELKYGVSPLTTVSVSVPWVVAEGFQIVNEAGEVDYFRPDRSFLGDIQLAWQQLVYKGAVNASWTLGITVPTTYEVEFNNGKQEWGIQYKFALSHILLSDIGPRSKFNTSKSQFEGQLYSGLALGYDYWTGLVPQQASIDFDIGYMAEGVLISGFYLYNIATSGSSYRTQDDPDSENGEIPILFVDGDAYQNLREIRSTVGMNMVCYLESFYIGAQYGVTIAAQNTDYGRALTGYIGIKGIL